MQILLNANVAITYDSAEISGKIDCFLGDIIFPSTAF